MSNSTNLEINAAPAVGTIVQVDWTSRPERMRFRGSFYRVMFANEIGFLLAPDQTVPHELSRQPDGTSLYVEARPTMVWLTNDGDTAFTTNCAVDLGFLDVRAGIPVVDPDTANYWPIEEFFPAYFGLPLESAVPLNLMSPDFAQDMLLQMYQKGSVIQIAADHSGTLSPYFGVPLQVMAVTQAGLLVVPEQSLGDPNAVFLSFDQVSLSDAAPGTYSFAGLIGGDKVLYQGRRYAVENFYRDILGVQFVGPAMQSRVYTQLETVYEPGYVIETYEPYWVPTVSFGIGFGFQPIFY